MARRQERAARRAMAARRPLERRGAGCADATPMSMNWRTSARNARHAGSCASPLQRERSAVCVSSNMIGKSQDSIRAGTSVRLRSASVASARTQRETTRFLRPKHNDRFGRLQRLFGHLVIGFARAQRDIPPDRKSLRLESFREALRRRLIIAVIREKDVGLHQVPALRAFQSRAGGKIAHSSSTRRVRDSPGSRPADIDVGERSGHSGSVSRSRRTMALAHDPSLQLCQASDGF